MVLYQSARLGAYADRLIHGFSGKPLTFGGLDFDRSDILANRQALCEALQVPAERLVVPQQVHSANVRTTQDTDFSQSDAVIVLDPDTPALLLFADCTPVILYDPKQHIGAVIHAGWRGTAQRISAITASRLQEQYGSRPEDLIGVVGPAIGGCCYEVSDEVVAAIRQTVQALPERYLSQSDKGTPHVDLQQVNALQLQEVRVASVEILPACTRCETDLLWSYRRGEPGRQSALLCLKPL